MGDNKHFVRNSNRMILSVNLPNIRPNCNKSLNKLKILFLIHPVEFHLKIDRGMYFCFIKP